MTDKMKTLSLSLSLSLSLWMIVNYTNIYGSNNSKFYNKMEREKENPPFPQFSLFSTGASLPASPPTNMLIVEQKKKKARVKGEWRKAPPCAENILV